MNPIDIARAIINGTQQWSSVLPNQQASVSQALSSLGYGINLSGQLFALTPNVQQPSSILGPGMTNPTPMAPTHIINPPPVSPASNAAAGILAAPPQVPQSAMNIGQVPTPTSPPLTVNRPPSDISSGTFGQQKLQDGISAAQPSLTPDLQQVGQQVAGDILQSAAGYGQAPTNQAFIQHESQLAQQAAQQQSLADQMAAQAARSPAAVTAGLVEQAGTAAGLQARQQLGGAAGAGAAALAGAQAAEQARAQAQQPSQQLALQRQLEMQQLVPQWQQQAFQLQGGQAAEEKERLAAQNDYIRMLQHNREQSQLMQKAQQASQQETRDKLDYQGWLNKFPQFRNKISFQDWLDGGKPQDAHFNLGGDRPLGNTDNPNAPTGGGTQQATDNTPPSGATGKRLADGKWSTIATANVGDWFVNSKGVKAAVDANMLAQAKAEMARQGGASAAGSTSTTQAVNQGAQNAQANANRSAAAIQQTANNPNVPSSVQQQIKSQNPVNTIAQTASNPHVPSQVQQQITAQQSSQPKKVDNTNTAVANAKVGDWIIRADGVPYPLNLGDINSARAKLGMAPITGSDVRIKENIKPVLSDFDLKVIQGVQRDMIRSFA